MFEALATIPAEELALRHARCRALLAELGYASDTIESMLAAGAAQAVAVG